jgi:Fe-Mn family superoxide dismutase
MAHEVPALPYDYAALEPYIDTQTMHLHHDKHHQAYVTNLNAALEKAPELQKLSAEDLIKGLENVPEAIRGAVRNNGGGHVNHSMFWKIMGPNAGGDPNGAIADAIKSTFGDVNAFKEKFNDAGPEAVRQRMGVAGARPGRQAAGRQLGQSGQSPEPGLLPNHGQ